MMHHSRVLLWFNFVVSSSLCEPDLLGDLQIAPPHRQPHHTVDGKYQAKAILIIGGSKLQSRRKQKKKGGKV
jgi:hypothetical protein